MNIEKRTVTPGIMKFNGYDVTSIDVHEDENGIVHKIQLWCKVGPLASALESPSPKSKLNIKSYAENTGMLTSLIAGGVIELSEDFDCKLMI